MTAAAKVSAPPAVTGWLPATVKNYSQEAQRPVAIHVQVGGSITFNDGAVSMTVSLQGIHFISPLDVTAASNAQVLFQ
jgi:hypothetical protein